MNRKRATDREWLEPESADVWSPYGPDVWSYEDNVDGVALFLGVNGEKLDVVMEARGPGYETRSSISVPMEDLADLVGFLHRVGRQGNVDLSMLIQEADGEEHDADRRADR